MGRTAENIRPQNLHGLLETKKKEMLLEDNLLKLQKDKVENILISSTRREKIFEEALLL
jgi:hypothetical protein